VLPFGDPPHVDAAAGAGWRHRAAVLARHLAVSPGPIITEMHRPGKLEGMAQRAPLQRGGTPEETAEAVLFLASSAASYITGANLAVAGGL
jgi:NAD(P)-dependent dehydrogenase (short-subunit alcohol dehydrogenase family)